RCVAGMHVRFFFFFFFQAEDGIRDWSVTGVQTCALPICLAASSGSTPVLACPSESNTITADAFEPGDAAFSSSGLRAEFRSQGRSEERRVGKEGGSGWAR